MIYIGGLFQLLLLAAIVVFVARKFLGKKSTTTSPAHSLRRFFQYLLLYGLLVIGAIGLSGLIGRFLSRNAVIVASNSELARNLSFALVGIPLFAWIAIWSKRRFDEDPSEASSLGFLFYLTVAPLTALILFMFAFNDFLRWAFRIDDFNGQSFARLIVWGAVWFCHWWIYVHSVSPHRSQPHDVLGSLIGLGTSVAGLSGVLAGTISVLFGLRKGELVAPSRPILSSVATVIVGASVWAVYWLANTAKSVRNKLWLGLVLIAGVAGGLLMAVISASTVLYKLLVWWLGNPASTEAQVHFRNLPTSVAVALAGALTWWYHRQVLSENTDQTRTEVQRIYEYLIAGIGLLAAAGGVTMVLVSFMESISRSRVLTAESQVNTLLAAITLLIVGAPIWWVYWHRLQRIVARTPEEEHESPTRRVYLFLLFGVGGIAAVISLLVGVYFVFDDAFSKVLGLSTLNRMRFPIGILVATAAIAGYHWLVYNAERGQFKVAMRVPHYVLLIGPRDLELSQAISRKTHGRVGTWTRTDVAETVWPHEKVLEVIETTTAEELVIFMEEDQIKAIPIDRK